MPANISMPSADEAILIGLGANLPRPMGMMPINTLQTALTCLNTEYGIQLVQCSSLYCTTPIPPSSQPPYFNAVAEISADMNAPALLTALLDIERVFDRKRLYRNEARTLDLDLLAYGRVISDQTPILPHPRMEKRDFVLAPLAEIRPYWLHPATGHTALDLLLMCPSTSIRQRILFNQSFAAHQ